MRNRIMNLVLTGFLALGSLLFWGCNQTPTTSSTDKPVISDAERAVAWTQVMNTMSKHAYYHGASKNLDEVNDIWVSENGEFAATATFTNPFGVWEGIKLIKEFYGTATINSQKKNLEALSKVNPEVKNVPDNLGIGSWLMHTQTTPIIEIAGDGKTAKGIWYSPGVGLNAEAKNGKMVVSGTWFWEKYGVDFAKENGQWKIWHIQMYYDLTPGISSDWTKYGQPNQEAKRELSEGTEEEKFMAGLPQATRANPYSYKAWSPTTVPVIMPKYPEPYYTFSETFSY